MTSREASRSLRTPSASSSARASPSRRSTMRERRNGVGRVGTRSGRSTPARTGASSSRPKATARSAGTAPTTDASCWPCRSSRTRSDPAKWDWVLWTPEGFYEATPGAEDVLKWVTNHGPDKRRDDASRLGHRQAASAGRAAAHVLDQLETARALGVDDIAAGEIGRSGRDRQRQAAGRGPACAGDRRRHVRRQGGRPASRLCRRGRPRRRDRAAREPERRAGQGEPLRRRQPDLSAQRQGRRAAILDALDAMAQAWRRTSRVRTSPSFSFRATAR